MLDAGQANPTLRTLAKLVTALSCTVGELFTNDDLHGNVGCAEGNALRG
jgi:DNA-binding Xre family transcriptional regulator